LVDTFKKLNNNITDNILKSKLRMITNFKKSRGVFYKLYAETLNRIISMGNRISRSLNTNQSGYVPYQNSDNTVSDAINNITISQRNISNAVSDSSREVIEDIYTQNGFVRERKNKLLSVLQWTGKTFLKFTIFLPFTVFNAYFTAFFKKEKTNSDNGS
jgi:hypothetical protein